MTSKQEKLAAARKKLKEFQGKQRESDNLKHKPIENLSTKICHNSSISYGPSSKLCSPSNENKRKEDESVKNFSKSFFDEQNFCNVNPGKDKIDSKGAALTVNFSKSSVDKQTLVSSTDENYLSDHSLLDVNKKIDEHSNICDPSSEYSNKLNLNICTSDDAVKSNVIDVKNVDLTDISKLSSEKFKNNITDDDDEPYEDLEKNNLSVNNCSLIQTDLLCQNKSKEFFNSQFPTNNAQNDIVKPLQIELQNHLQTINMLVQQRNDAQIALTQVQNLLSEKTGQIMNQQHQLENLSAVINDLNKKLIEFDSIIKDLETENKKNILVINEGKLNFEELKSQFESKNEEYSELKTKYEEKNKECQFLLYSLNETQSQLSLCQIQCQPFTNDNNSLATKFSIIENENYSLKAKIESLEKELEVAKTENQESSQNFQAYVEEYNTQLKNLNLKLNELEFENEELKQFKKMLSDQSNRKTLYEENSHLEDYKMEIADLHNQISVLTEKNEQMQRNSQEMENEISDLKKRYNEQEIELQTTLDLLQETKVENKKLLMDSETPRVNVQLLAAMESDKIAAAKAVSQNQKLKCQVIELEEAFVKLSEEKLELTNQLSYEKHINKELQSQLDNLTSHHDHDHYNGHSHDGCGNGHSENDCENEVVEMKDTLVNDSQDVEELRSIIRQLQEDKIELKTRLNLMMTNGEFSSERQQLSENFVIPEDETKSENTKLLLKQMEEKVRKTMNEIAVLDEEKQKLEHLVLQLQGETETIGEYITLYQKQRMVLKQRAQEKDNQLIQLSKDKQELKSKLQALDELVQNILKEKSNASLQQEMNSIPQPSNQVYENTVDKIRALINEIESTNLVNSHSMAFEHCSCCSGRLITI